MNLKALILAVMATLFTSAWAKLPSDASVADFISDALVNEQLFLATEGELQPFTSETGEKNFNYEVQNGCSGKDCKGLLVSYSSKSYDECLHPSMPYRFDELPVKMADGQTAVFTLPTITDPAANNRDFFVFHSKGVCYEFDWGYNGSRFDKAVDLANRLIGR